MEDCIIVAKNLAKSYGGTRALSGIDIVLPKGKSLALVGPDGAGKTTTIRILCGFIRPDSGESRIFGETPGKGKAKSAIGYLSQRFSLYSDLSIDENIAFFAEIHGVDDYTARRDRLLEITRLEPYRERQAGKLSGGMKQKLSLACALVHEPELILMDEPTTGVDPISRREFWAIITELIRDGMTVLVATPYLDEAERCDLVGLLYEGSFLAMDSPAAIKASLPWKVVEVVCGESRRAARALSGDAALSSVQAFGDRLSILAADLESAELTIRARLGAEAIDIASMRAASPTLENVFMSLVSGGSKRETGQGAPAL
jgi:ABC-2 type transport system ATP-binding protein